jgi:hypothetical protein
VEEALADGKMHTFGLDWQADGLKYYVDSVLVRTVQAGKDNVAACLNNPMHVILSVSLPNDGSNLDELSGEQMMVKSFKHSNQKPTCSAADGETTPALEVCSDRSSCAAMFDWCGSDGLSCNCNQGECVPRSTRTTTDDPTTETLAPVGPKRCSADGGTLACGADCTLPCPEGQICAAVIQYCQGDGSCAMNSEPKCPTVSAVATSTRLTSTALAPNTEDADAFGIRCKGATRRKFCTTFEECKWNGSEKFCYARRTTTTTTTTSTTKATSRACDEPGITKRKSCINIEGCKWNKNKMVCYDPNASVTDAPTIEEPADGDGGDACDEPGITKRNLCVAIEGCKWNGKKNFCYDPNVSVTDAPVTEIPNDGDGGGSCDEPGITKRKSCINIEGCVWNGREKFCYARTTTTTTTSTTKATSHACDEPGITKRKLCVVIDGCKWNGKKNACYAA